MRERPAVVNLEDSVHKLFHRLDFQGRIYYRGHFCGYTAHQVSACKHHVPQFRLAASVFYAGGLDYVPYPYARRACHFAPLAIEAVLECLVEEYAFLQSEPLPVRPSLLRSRIVGIYRYHGAVYSADCTFDALLEIVFAYIVFLHFHISLEIYEILIFLLR